MKRSDWVRLPTNWINEKRLSDLRWGRGGSGSNNTAALMSLIAMAHAADETTGASRITYTMLGDVTGLSRAKLARGLEILREMGLIERGEERSRYKLADYDPNRGWAKLPAKSMYHGDTISAFEDFKLRHRAELDAMKLFLLFIARRSQSTNAANIGYTAIEEYSGIERGRIKTGISLLTSLMLIQVDQVPRFNEPGVSHAYRMVGIEPYHHMGTRGRIGL
jgi:DNA-binding transcriptional ArsR family regulator